MYLRELLNSAENVRGVGERAARLLAKVGITSVASLLCYYPRDWEDRSVVVPLRDFQKRQRICTVVRVLAHDWFGFGAMKTLKIHVEDNTAKAVLVCFNRPFLAKQLGVGKSFWLWGHFYYKYGEIQSTAFEVEPWEENENSAQTRTGKVPPGSTAAAGRGLPDRSFGRIQPVYPLTAGLTQGMLRKYIKNALAEYVKPLNNELPEAVIERDGLLSKAEAIRAIHFPASMGELTLARKTLIYEELFYLEVVVGKRSLERRSISVEEKAIPSPDPLQSKFTPLQEQLLERLPFPLTTGQIRAVEDINRDMSGPYPMARLLQGDVGSGKTLVSFLAALRAVDGAARGQAAIMAPTELLARQHAENAAKLLEPLGLRPAFLTGNIKAGGRGLLLKALASGEVDVVVGTHALFSRDVEYKNLRLVVVDEQHRFGVTQRQAIMVKGDHPNLLMMSATPIPRTLALTVFGDLDVSVIPDLPPGRKPVKTHLAKESNEQKVYDFVARELAAGRQAYFVYPLIEANDNNSLKDAESMAESLAKKIFPKYPVALIHSRLDEEEKRQKMEAFRQGEIRILAATSVVEVGVDVPNANCMVIEHAERFGLSALHQLRGRVGRGADQAYCFLIYTDHSENEGPGAPSLSGEGAGVSLTEAGKTRLKVMLETTDGFIIAEEDLKLRGPGEIAGTVQAGYLSLGLADPVRDAEELARARTDAFALLEADPGLEKTENRRIAEVLERASPFSQLI
jgi:ATP-dependent DNA helicase RecG